MNFRKIIEVFKILAKIFFSEHNITKIKYASLSFSFSLKKQNVTNEKKLQCYFGGLPCYY